MRKKTLKVSDEEYELLKTAKASLMRGGLEDLKDQTVCTNCGAELHGFYIEFHYSECPECGTRQQGIWISTTGAFALGALVGLGIGALLAHLLSKRKEKK